MTVPKSIRYFFDFLAALTAGAGLWVHAWVGMADEGHAVLHPVGHGTIFSFLMWLVALVCSVTALAVSRGRSPIAIVAAIVVVAGLVLLCTGR